MTPLAFQRHLQQDRTDGLVPDIVLRDGTSVAIARFDENTAEAICQRGTRVAVAVINRIGTTFVEGTVEQVSTLISGSSNIEPRGK